ncbi:hypothetical protein [Streptomyces sp. UNOB3_S3]|uniref:hypothetical protein n=1 Tax=Streptomyces sp. UNOB3_S3 TaxID=2871682 RepID=UPI001E297477|nr:hypothetical protein [Streptomyces sp. UNOB3_S3]MCC3777976.1 hypothetical protein [Streptomyces sp. UNOB3_S3]
MANPQQNPGGEYDPAGSTQMFRAFVADESAPAPVPSAGAVPGGGRAAARRAKSSGPGAGLIVGVIVAIVLVAGAAWLALS